ncbi:MAG: ATP-binding protein [Nannocystaceae bacterium]
MPRRFNTSGPNRPAEHYTLPVLARLPQVRELVQQKLYFVLHAPRQVGKTTSLLALAQELSAEGDYAAVLLSMEQGEPFSHDPGAAELAVLESWRGSAEAWLPAELQPPPWPEAPPGGRIGAALRTWARVAPRPLVVFLDEFDALRDRALVSVLRQVRAGFSMRPEHFPWSLALIGLRDVRDYRVSTSEEGRLGTASPFNIKAESLTLRNFSHAEVTELYGQHAQETGQSFADEAIALVHSLTQGQPWLVNALGRQLTEVLVTDRSRTIEVQDVQRAKDILIRRQDTHLDSLMDRLREPRVRALLEPMLAGTAPGDVPEDDRRFAIDLGLLRRSELGGLEVANPIYREIIVRTLASGPSDALPQIPTTWLTPDGDLDQA